MKNILSFHLLLTSFALTFDIWRLFLCNVLMCWKEGIMELYCSLQLYIYLHDIKVHRSCAYVQSSVISNLIRVKQTSVVIFSLIQLTESDHWSRFLLRVIKHVYNNRSEGWGRHPIRYSKNNIVGWTEEVDDRHKYRSRIRATRLLPSQSPELQNIHVVKLWSCKIRIINDSILNSNFNIQNM